MNLSVEHVLMIVLVAFALHYLMQNCGCRQVESFDNPFSSLQSLERDGDLILKGLIGEGKHDVEYAKGLGYLNPPMLWHNYKTPYEWNKLCQDHPEWSEGHPGACLPPKEYLEGKKV